MGNLFVCFVVLMTRRLLLQVSDTTEEVKPMTAFLPNFFNVASEFGLGNFSCYRMSSREREKKKQVSASIQQIDRDLETRGEQDVLTK